MLRRSRRRKRAAHGNFRWATATVIVLALIISPFAIAQQTGVTAALIGGQRNPRPMSQEFTRETQVIADNSSYGTRQSNKSSNGGGAIYGCRSGPGGTPQRMRPCVRASNLRTGLAFEFSTDGNQGGTITAAGGDNSRPFTTNATGVATGLNAERVGSQTSQQIVDSATTAAHADAVDLVNSASSAAHTDAVNTVNTALSFAQVLATGSAQATRGVSSVSRASTGIYSVAFERDVSGCALTATAQAGVATPIVTQLGPDNRTVTVITYNVTVPADRAFHITAIC
jgi:hypothetical protein